MFQLIYYILTLTCILSLVIFLTSNFLKLSKLKRPGKTSIDFKLLKVFEFHMEHEDEKQEKAI